MGAAPPSCDIVIVNYNTQEKILGCLDSIFSFLPATCQVWVVDNASSDGSVPSIEKKFPQVNIICSETNKGFGGGSNLGAQKGEKEYILFLNPDTRVEQGWLEGLLAPLQQDSKTGLSTGKILLMNQTDRINTCGNSVHLTGLTLCRGMGLRKEEFNRLTKVDAVSGAAFAIRRELFERLGGFDEDMFLYMEDTDLSWRVWLSGNSCVFTPESVILHDYKLRIGHQKIFFQERNRYLMLLKNLKWPTLLVSLPAQLLAEIITWAFVIFKHPTRFKEKWNAYRWIVTHWRSIARKRKVGRVLRKVGDRELLKHSSYKIDFSQVIEGNLALIPRLVFNPLFFLLHRISLAVVWW